MENIETKPVGLANLNKPPLSKAQRFAIGGMGGLLPILAMLVTIDLAVISTMIDKQDYTLGLCIGFCIRVVGLFILGGVIAALNSEVVNPLALVQIGIAAPALVTSYLSGAALVKAKDPRVADVSSWIVTSAHAADEAKESYEVAGGLIGDIISGTIPGFGRELSTLDGGAATKNSWPELGGQGTIQGVPGPAGAAPGSVPQLNLIPLVGPMMELPGQPGILNFIVVNNQVGSCIPTPAPYYAAQQLMASFPPPIFTITNGVCVPPAGTQ